MASNGQVDGDDRGGPPPAVIRALIERRDQLGRSWQALWNDISTRMHKFKVIFCTVVHSVP
eukprot:scaffold16006_cov35-Prasinocladus_malaysianus.AAC.1